MKLFYYIYSTFKKGIEYALRNFIINLITISIISASLVLFSISIIVIFNLNLQITGRNEPIHYSVFFKENIEASKIKTIYDKLGQTEGLISIEFLGKERAKDRFLTDNENLKPIVESMSENPFPPTIELQIDSKKSLKLLESIAQNLLKLQEIDDVVYTTQWLSKYSAIIRLIKLLGSLFLIFIFSTIVFIISNTIKLTLFYRKEEIEIMLLVGGTKNYVKLPFLIEGSVLGLFGSLISIGLTYGLFLLLNYKLNSLPFFNSSGIEISFLPLPYITVIIATGICLGFVGSYFSLGRFMKLGEGL
ncbi:MAG: permease-like cell division protein FtsX [Pseudomonadota bacterium]